MLLVFVESHSKVLIYCHFGFTAGPDQDLNRLDKMGISIDSLSLSIYQRANDYQGTCIFCKQTSNWASQSRHTTARHACNPITWILVNSLDRAESTFQAETRCTFVFHALPSHTVPMNTHEITQGHLDKQRSKDQQLTMYQENTHEHRASFH